MPETRIRTDAPLAVIPVVGGWTVATYQDGHECVYPDAGTYETEAEAIAFRDGAYWQRPNVELVFTPPNPESETDDG